MPKDISLYDQHPENKELSKRSVPGDAANAAADAGRPGFLCFTLEGDEYGVDLHVVQEIVKPPALTWVPTTPPHILGVVSIRGAVITLVDLRQLMGLPPTAWPRTGRVLIVENEGERIGMLVDAVTLVRRVDEEELETGTSLDTGELTDYMLCLFRPGEDQVVVVVDLDTMLSEKL